MFLLVQVETLRRQDTSTQLRETQEELAALREEHSRLRVEMGVGKSREEQLRQQLNEGDERRRKEQDLVQQVRGLAWTKAK